MTQGPEGQQESELLDVMPVLDGELLWPIVAPTTVEEVYDSIKSIPEVSFKEQRDRLRERIVRAGSARCL
jgi:hypothetical protein